MNNTNKLSLEQEFKLAIYTNKIQQLNSKNTRKYLINILEKIMIKDNIIKYYIKNSII
uniref:Uncharacterized protein ycf18 n=1 Tax=Dasyclonium flaccidum TaxID=2007274 RepID=A0A1Z1MKH5_9FLOR|nr:phycobilisome degradation protein [Dasyclonium flaccidum]ARW66587.1 phycobilisome degradation protein [Dasyclonium flaccidum]